jgi:WS/DGAT/MGAT family acyltransferase
MSDHLTALDATFLELEQADDSAHMHIGAIMVFDPGPGVRRPSREQLVRHLAQRLGMLPRYRQRLSEPHTGGFSWPSWVEDPHFQIDRHIARAALPEPGGHAELMEWASDFFAQRLDRRRPLWEMVLVEGLDGGRWALATKTHHCMVDGVGSVDVGHLMLDAEPHPHGRRRSPQAPGPAAVSDGGTSALARILAPWELPASALSHAARIGAHGALHPRESLRRARAALEVIVRDELVGAPGSSINVPIGTLRSYRSMSVPLAQIKDIKADLGGTVNDVVLAVVAGGLRELLAARGEDLPRRGLRAMVPMNVRTEEERLALGNKVSSLFVELPVAESDPLARYRETVARSRALKDDGRQAEGTAAVIDIAGVAPPAFHSALAQALYAKRLFNLTITNVPGPPGTLYAFGAPLRAVYPLVPLAAEHAIGVAVVSYDGEVFFGVVADADTVPDLPVMLDGMDAALAQLRVCSGSGGPIAFAHARAGQGATA